MFDQNTIDTALDDFSGLDIDLAFFGSGSNNDLDIFAINRTSNPNNSYKNTNLFLQKIQNFKKHLDINIIVHYKDRWIINNNKRIVHLLYYPSYHHLRFWELPNFISNIAYNGTFIIGDNRLIKILVKDYEKKDLNYNLNILEYHVLNFSKIAIANLVYISTNPTIFDLDYYRKNLLHIYKHIFIELIISKTDRKIHNKLSTWKQIMEILQKEFADLSSLYFRINDIIIHQKKISLNEAESLFQQFLVLSDNTI